LAGIIFLSKSFHQQVSNNVDAEAASEAATEAATASAVVTEPLLSFLDVPFLLFRSQSYDLELQRQRCKKYNATSSLVRL
jgi:hypothetical protein